MTDKHAQAKAFAERSLDRFHRLFPRFNELTAENFEPPEMAMLAGSMCAAALQYEPDPAIRKMCAELLIEILEPYVNTIN